MVAARRRHALHRHLLAWFDAQARTLPWRGRRDAYGVWLAEIMLQQTQVAVVVPRYLAFRRRFPSIAALAAASERQVVAAWQGLGYYGRARRLHAAARAIVARHGGRFPRQLAAVRALPGIGRYTAGAILSIACEQPLPVVDGNVARVLCRLELLDGNLDDAVTRRRLWELAGGLLPAAGPGRWNEALMELGALVCTPAAPACAACPWRRQCRARAAGRVAGLPPPRRRRLPPRVMVAVAWLERRGRLGVTQRPQTGALAGFWELPAADLAAASAGRRGLAGRPAPALVRRLEALGLGGVVVGEPLARVEHSMFDRRASMTVYRVSARGRGPLRFVDPARPGPCNLTTATRKIVVAVGGG